MNHHFRVSVALGVAAALAVGVVPTMAKHETGMAGNQKWTKAHCKPDMTVPTLEKFRSRKAFDKAYAIYERCNPPVPAPPPVARNHPGR